MDWGEKRRMIQDERFLDDPSGTTEECELLSEKDICRIFSVSRWTLQKWRKRSKNPLPFIRVRGSHVIRYLRSDVERWFRKQRIGGGRTR